MSCSSKNKNDLENYLTSVKSRSTRSIDSIPIFKTPNKTIYQNEKNRNPFSFHRESVINKNKDPLTTLSLNSFHMVGVIQQDKKRWGLVATSDGHVYKVSQGSQIGQSQGRVISVGENVIDIVEVHSTEMGTREEHVQLKMKTY